MRDEAAAHGFNPGHNTSMLGVVTSLLRARHLLIRTSILFVAITAAVTITTPRRFVSEAAVMSIGGRAASGLSGLAAQFGVSVGSGDAAASPAFVANLLSAPDLRRRLASDTLVDASGRRIPVASLYEIDDNSPARATAKLVKRLGEDLRIAEETETGLVRIRSAALDAEVSALLAKRLIQHGDSALVARRQRQAESEAQYATDQLARARADLARAEGALQSFMAANRRFVSPRLVMESERLRREVMSREAVVSALSQSVEQARLEAGRPTPVLSVVEPPSVPALAEPRGLVIRSMFALVAGLVIGSCIALFRDSLRRQASQLEGDGASFDEVTRDLGDELRHPWRLVVPARRKAA